MTYFLFVGFSSQVSCVQLILEALSRNLFFLLSLPQLAEKPLGKCDRLVFFGQDSTAGLGRCR